MSMRLLWVLGLVLLSTVLVTSCSRESSTDRARKAAEEIQRSIPNVDATAVAQEVSPKIVEEAQERLSQLNEYMGETNGNLDSVTIHAIQAFQRSAGIPDDGVLNDQTLTRLRAATAN